MREFKDRRGVKTFNLFKQTWKAGRLVEKKGKPAHLVIYGPDDSEHHVYGENAKSLLSYSEYDDEFFLDKTKLKIYVITSILDERDNWCFDMFKSPNSGRVKVVFEDCTIQWIENFSGDWSKHQKEIHTEHPTRTNPEWERSLGKTIRDKEGKIVPGPSQFIWEPAIEYKNIIAWRK